MLTERDDRTWRSRASRRARLVAALLSLAGTLVLLGATPGVAGAVQSSPSGVWSGPTQVGSDIQGLSCASTTFCVAVDATGRAFTYDGTSWSAGTTVALGALDTVACPTTSFCVTGDVGGSSYTYNGSTWSAAHDLDPGVPMAAVSCASASFCVMVDQAGFAFTWNGTSWLSGTENEGQDLVSVACPVAGFCWLGDASGNIWFFDGTNWDPSPVTVTYSAIQSMSCSTTFCVAGTQSGILYVNNTFQNGVSLGSWTSGIGDENNVITGLSCSPDGYCLGVTDAGTSVSIYANDVNAYDWNYQGQAANTELLDVSCPSASLCVAGDYLGAVYTDTLAPPTVSSVTFTGDTTNPTITITGSGFGTQADLGTPVPTGCQPQTGADYGDNIWIQDQTANWLAGRGGACVGWLIQSYSDTQIVLTPGSAYYGVYPYDAGDSYTLSLYGQLYNGTVAFSLPISIQATASQVSATSSVDENALPTSALSSGNQTPAGAAASAPLRAIPLSTLALGSTPLRAIPLRAIPLGAVPGAATALGSTLLSDLPVTYPAGCTGTACTGWTGLLAGSALAIDPLQSVSLEQVLADPVAGPRFDALPVDSLDLSSSPLRAIPLASLALAGIPLRAIALPGAGDSDSGRLTAWCTELTTLGSSCSAFGIDPSNPETSTGIDLMALSLAGVPVDSIPLRAISLTSIDITSSPLRAIPLRAITLDNTPLRAIPLRAIDLTTSPLRAIPLRAIATVSDVVDCTDFPAYCSSTTTATLGDASDAGALLSTATLDDLSDLSSSALAAVPLRAIDMTSSPLRAIPLANIDVASTPLGGIPIESIDMTTAPLGAVPLRAIADLPTVVDCTDFPADCTSTATDTLADAQAQGAILAGATLDQLASLDDPTLASFPLRAIDMATSPLRAIPLRAIPAVDEVVDCTLVDCSATSTATLGDASSADAILSGATLDDLGAYLGTALGDLSTTTDDSQPYNGATLADLGPYLSSTLGDLLAGIDPSTPGFPSFTLTDLLLGFMPPSSYPWEDLDLSSVPVSAYANNAGAVDTFTTSVTVPGSSAQTVTLTVTLPAGWSYGAGHTMLDGSPLADPSDTTGPLTWTVTLGAGTHTLTVQADASTVLSSGTATATAQVGAGPVSTSTTPVQVVDGNPADSSPGSATPLAPGTLDFGHLTGPGDTDWWSITANQGDELALSLSNLPADYDLELFAPAGVQLQGTPTQQVGSVTDTAPSVTGAIQAPDTASDVPTTPPAGYQLYAVSINRGTADETIQTAPLEAGTYLLQVSGYNGASSPEPYMLRAVDLSTPAPQCTISYPNAQPAPAALPRSYPTDVDTLFLVDTQRMTAAYGATAEQQVLHALDTFSGGGVVSAVVPVDGSPTVRSAYATWDENDCDPQGANGVVQAISALLDSIRAAHPTVRNVVIVGADDQIPFARIADGTAVSNERDYGTSTFPGESNVLADLLSEGYYMSDDPFTASTPLQVGSTTLYVPQLATGRLVETPTEIESALSRFEQSDGVLDASAALSTGYSFLTSGATLVASDLAKVSDRQVASLISETWSHQDLDNALTADPTPQLVSLNAHFDYNRALPAIGNTTGTESDLFTTTDISTAPTDAFAGRLLFSMGCHSGLDLDDVELASDGIGPVTDWAKTFADAGSVWVGNTGYGYGDTSTVAYSAALMVDFANNLDGSMSVGAALTNAKQQYAGNGVVLSPYDIKSMMESTFYGLPMYGLNSTPPASPPPPTPPATYTDPATGLTAANVTTGTLDYTPVTGTDGGTYYSLGGPDPQYQTTEFRPIEPLDSIDVTQPASGGGLTAVAHGALITGLASQDVADPDPELSTPAVDGGGPTVGAAATDPFPAQMQRVATIEQTGTTASTTQQLDLVTGQYIPDSNTPGSGNQRLYDSVQAEVLYAPATTTDYTPPTIVTTNGYSEGSNDLFTVSTTDPGAAVKEVTVLYTDAATPGTWSSVPLSSSDGSTWSAVAPATASGQVAYIVQAVDAAGNVAVSSNKGTQFPALAAPSAPVLSTPGVAGLTAGAAGSATVAAAGSPGPTLTESGPLPGGVFFDGDSGTFAGTPAPGTAGVYPVTVTASNGVGSATEPMTLVVADPTGTATPRLTGEALSVPVSATSSETAEVPIWLSAASASPVTVTWATANSTATAGLDYVAGSGTVTFAPGQVAAEVPVTVDPDAQAGPNLKLVVRLEATGASVATPAVTVTLANPLGPLTASVSDPLEQPAGSPGTMTFTVTLSSAVAPGRTVTVHYATVDGTAKAGTDYTATSGTLTFTAGESTATVAVPVLDTSAPTKKTLSLHLSKATGGLSTLGVGKGTIATTAPEPYLLAPVMAVTAPTSGTTTVEVPITLSWPSSSTVTVFYATKDGTAVAPRNYQALAGGQVQFSPGQTQVTIPVTLDANPDPGNNLLFTFALSKPRLAVLGSAAGKITVVNPQGPLWAVAGSPEAQPAEGQSTLDFVVSLSAPITSSNPVRLSYATANGTAVAGTDYQATTGILTFGPGDSSQVVSVPILDASVATAKTLDLKLSKPSGVTVATPAVVGTIAPG